MKTWKVLPTDPRYLDLTDEQKEWLWEDYLIDNPELARKIENSRRTSDEEFNKDWDSMEESDSVVDEDLEESVLKNFEEFSKEAGLNDIRYKEETQNLLNMTNTGTERRVDDDWEEVDD